MILLAAVFLFSRAGGSSAYAAASLSGAESHPLKKHILVLYSYGPAFPVQQQFAAGFNSVIAGHKLGPQNIFHEYLDIIPTRTPQQKALLRNLLLNKYAGIRFDLIITIADSALDFLLKEGSGLSPGQPVMACNTRKSYGSTVTDRKIHYVPLYYDLKGTLELALKLLPRTNRVVFLAGSSENDLRMEEQARRDFAPWVDKIAFDYVSRLSVEEMFHMVKTLPADSILIYSIVSSDRTGRIFIPKDLLITFARESKVPCFGLASTYLGHGIVGGSIQDVESAGAYAGRIALDVLAGKPFSIEELPGFTRPIFDWREIRRWNLDASRLPGNAVIINRPPTLWSQYRGFVIAVSAVIVVLFSLAMSLVIQVRRRISAEGRVRQSEAYFRELFDASSEAMIIHDALTGAVIDVNSTMRSMFGYSRDEALRLTPSNLGTGESPYTEAEAGRRIREAASGAPQMFEWRTRDSSGRPFWVEVNLKLVTLMGQERILATLRDIGERKQLEAQLFQAQKMESIGRLAGGVAHDFNNMLGVILGYLELSMRQLNSPERLKQNLNEIFRAADRSRKITRQLLAFSRREMISPRAVNLNDQIAESEKNLGRLIGEDIRLVLELQPDLWPVKIDPAQVDQVLMNLCINARDAMPDGGDIVIGTAGVTVDENFCHTHLEAAPGEYVRISVSDTGTGMSREVLEHLFEPFYTTKETGKGTGLGLATTYGIVSQNRGFIDVYSEPGCGTVFKIYLPRFREGVVAEEKPAAAEAGGTGTVLLVEDDAMVADMTASMLESMGYSAVRAASPMDAIEYCRRGEAPVDVILTDVVMPGMNGREMADSIRSSRPEARVVFMSGYTSDLVAARGIVEEGMFFIQKPFSMRGLGEILRKALGASGGEAKSTG
jgi:PAS domain S-box-containing protein